MNTIWNECELKIPPLITIQLSDVSFVKKVRSIFMKRSPQNDMDSLLDEFTNSAALLSRLMARRKNSFHNMSGFKFVCKLNTALGRLLKVNVEQLLSNFCQMLPDVIIDAAPQGEVPSRNSFDYILLRIISVHKLYQRIAFCCTESADYFNKLIKNNFFMETIALFVAVIAKLWDLTQKLGNTFCDLYSKLLPLRECFPPIKSSHEFKEYDFPKRLDRFSMQIMNEVNIKPNNEIVITMQKESPAQRPSTKVSVLSKLQKSEDIGRAISRDSLKPVIDLSRIHNIEDIRRYFKEENEKRNKSLNSCETKYILKHEWLAIQKLVERKIIANDHKKALSIFRKFITSKT